MTTTTATPVVHTRGLVKEFPRPGGEPNVVLKGVDLTIDRGEFVSIMGPSGSGKSTLLYTMSGMDAVTDGVSEFDGRDLAGLSEKELARLRLTNMGFVFQRIHLLKNLSLLDNVVLPGFMAAKSDRAEVEMRARELLERVGIGDLADRTVDSASGGQLQRVGICRALVNEPPVLFCDEPTGALDSASATEIMDLLAEVNAQGTAVVVVTHDPRVAARTDRVIVLVDGKVHGDRRQGRWSPETADRRHAELTTWLVEQGM